jgi:hypothetical protein
MQTRGAVYRFFAKKPIPQPEARLAGIDRGREKAENKFFHADTIPEDVWRSPANTIGSE